MAITKIWSVKSRLDTSLNYITNPEKTNVKPDIDAIEGVIQYIENKDKTEECKYVRAFNCSKDNAFDRMIQTQDSFGKRKRKNGVVAYHLVQSFKEFETTPEIAHQCGIELIEKLFADKYEVVLATHINHNHLHNHILINAVSFKDGKKYRRSFKDYFIDIRKTSDEICREHCLSVIEKPQHRGMHYAEWKALNEGKPTIRGQVREELDEIIKSSYTMQIFWKELKQRGYVVHRKGENIKYTSIIPPFGKRPIRLDKLGAEYTEAAIMERITAERNGIRTMPPSQRKKIYKYNGNLKTVPRKKLKGFQALYFHYLYLFKKIRKKQTPQKVSFFMRDEIIKVERYQKQFKFLYNNGIETVEQLQTYKAMQEQQIDNLTETRQNLYNERNNTDEQGEISQQISEINGTLKVCRADVRMCKAILTDADCIKEKYHTAQELQTQTIEKQKEVAENEHKRRSR